MEQEQINSLLTSAGVLNSTGALNWPNLIGGFIFGAIGLVAFTYGKKEREAKPMGIGIALMCYSLFISNTFWVYTVGIALTALLYFWRD